MTTPTGTITLLDVQAEFGGATPISLSEYYAGGGNVPSGTAGVPSSGAISLNDLRGKSGVYYGTLSANTSSIVEGGSGVTFTWSGGTGLANGTYYWRLEGTNINASDFSSLTGSFTVTSNTGSFSVSALSEAAYEGTESFRALVGATSGVASPLVTSAFVSLTETATYSVSSATSVNEGSSITFYVTTTNFPNGTLYYSLDSVAGVFQASDVSSGVLTGSLSITGGSGSVTVGIAADTFTDGQDTFKFNLRTGSTSGSIVAYSQNITINDTSTSPPTYSVVFSPTQISEGEASQYRITTSNVPSGTTLYFTDTHGTASPTLDTVGGVSSGTITTTGNLTTGYVWATLDGSSESTETFVLYLRTGSTSGPVVAQATLNILNALSGVNTLALTYTGGVSGALTELFMQITSIAAYPASRTFNLTYRVNGEAETAAGLLATTLVVGPNSTSSTKVKVFSRNPANLLSSIYFIAKCTGHIDKTSNILNGIYI